MDFCVNTGGSCSENYAEFTLHIRPLADIYFLVRDLEINAKYNENVNMALQTGLYQFYFLG
jgi:hypothetical protein